MQTFPASESTLSATHLGLWLQERFELGPETVCKLFRTGMNHLYQVLDGDKKFVYRVYTLNWRTKEEVAEEVRLLLYLNENAIPVSYPIAAKDGTYIQEINAAEGTRYGVLFSYADGEKIIKFSAEASYQAGVAMAKMHRATANFKIERINYTPATLLTEGLARTKAFFTEPYEEIKFLEDITAYLLDVYENADARQMRNGVVHMDLWFDNMHFNGDDKVTFFDFDFCGNGWQAHDIAYFLNRLNGTNQGTDDYGPKSESFLKGYESIIKISDEEKRMIPYLSLGILVFYIGQQCDRYDTWSNIFLNEFHLKMYVAAMKRWMNFNGVVIA